MIDKKKVILSIETSCDDTSIAVLLIKNNKVLLQKQVSQISHSKFGGVVPEIASREHVILLQSLFDEVLQEIESERIAAVAVTKGPGLIGSLLCGVSFAKGIAIALNVPLIGVNHLQGHLMSASFEEKLKYPLIFLLVSGGHTQIVIAESFEKYKLITETLDDAVGEVFDKVAKYLDLGYPGGPVVEKLSYNAEQEYFIKKSVMHEFDSSASAEIFDTDNKKFLKSFYNNFFYNNSDFSFKPSIEDEERIELSFSGLKTQVKNFINQKKEKNELTQSLINQICYESQKAIIKTLINKLFIVVKDFVEKTKHIKIRKQLVICGGVACNKKIQNAIFKIAHAFRLSLVYPPKEFTTDNAAMIGRMGIEKYKRGMFDDMKMQVKSKMDIAEL
jgi:N6-L-threonylcarbamoyladenine synthase